ncbi:MAG: ABC transporter permease [Croceibacterium sp.]
MNNLLLVALREVRQVTGTRGFWIMLLAVPLALAISIFASSQLAPERSSAYTIVDRSGRFAPQIEQRLEYGYQQEALRDLATYVERWQLADADPGAPWSNRQSWLSAPEIARFIQLGGADAAIERLRPHLPEGAPEFEPEERFYVAVSPPANAVTGEGAEAFGASVKQALENDIATDDGKLPYALALYIPENYGQSGAVAHVFTNGRGNQTLLAQVREGLTAALRQETLEDSGLAPAAAAQVQALQAPLAVTEPAPGEGRGVIATRSIVPIALDYLLLLTAITTGSMMLQGVVEERSNKLIESVLACLEPDALMRGKLLGLGAVGFVIMVVWAGCGLAAALWFDGFAADVLRPSLEALDDPLLIAAMIFYFLAGYVVLSMLFLAIGSVSDSMQDAQAYLTPVILLIMIPVVIVMQAAMRGPDEFIVQLLSWIPLYTPFAMLARLGTGVSVVEIVGTGLLLVAFIWLELVFLGRLFRASLLGAGKPAWRQIFAMVRSPDAGR